MINLAVLLMIVRCDTIESMVQNLSDFFIS